jgi:hypothetical protein
MDGRWLLLPLLALPFVRGAVEGSQERKSRPFDVLPPLKLSSREAYERKLVSLREIAKEIPRIRIRHPSRKKVRT